MGGIPNARTRWVSIGGERKSLFGWSKDPRCEVGYKRLQTRYNSRKYAVRGEVHDPSLLLLPKRVEREENVRSKPRTFFEHEGERKTLTEWARDGRCSVARTTLIHRMKRGWSFERALLTPSQIPPRDPA